MTSGNPEASAIDPVLARDIESLAPPGLLIRHRLISPGDEHALLGEEAASIASTIPNVRRASGAVRIVARQLLGRLGYAHCALPKAASGAPIWPAGTIGSLAHDDHVAVAAVAACPFGAIGIDIEPAERLAPDVLELVATPREQDRTGHDPLAGRLLFAAKEAVYKAAYPLDRAFLEFCDIEVDLVARTAVTRSGRRFALRYCVSSRVLVLAVVAQEGRAAPESARAHPASRPRGLTVLTSGKDRINSLSLARTEGQRFAGPGRRGFSPFPAPAHRVARAKQ